MKFPTDKRLEQKENELLNSISCFFNNDIENAMSVKDKKSLYKLFFFNNKLIYFFNSVKHKKPSITLFENYINTLENVNYNFTCVKDL